MCVGITGGVPRTVPRATDEQQGQNCCHMVSAQSVADGSCSGCFVYLGIFELSFLWRQNHLAITAHVDGIENTAYTLCIQCVVEVSSALARG